MKSAATGYIPFKKYKIFYEVFGEQGNTSPPLLILHGGPGGAHNYLLGLAQLAKNRQVIFYDQLGSGLSDRPNDTSLWTIETFIEEINTVRDHLKLEAIDLLGHSWGGMLAASYALTMPKGLRKLILASAMLDMPLYRAEVEKLKHDLPFKVYDALKKHEAAGTTSSAEYKEAHKVYDRRHIYRGELFPKKYQRPESSPYGQGSYEYMWGVSEAYANGKLKNWSVIDRLHTITQPVLVTSGQYDELTPDQAIRVYDQLPNAKIRIFAAASHAAHVEAEAEYLEVVDDFLKSPETQ